MAVLRRALSAVLVELRDEQDSRRSYAFLSRAGSLDRQEPKRRTKSNACSRSKGSDPRAEKHVAAGPGLSCPTSLFDLPACSASSCRNSPTPSFVKKELGSNGTGTSINHLISPSHDEDLCLTHSRHYSTGVPRLEVGDPAVARRLLTHAGSHHGVVDGSCATPSRVRLRCV
jgi:hypothetical protein